MEVLKQDDSQIYGKTKTGEDVVIAKADVREARKLDVFSSIVVGLAAVAAVIARQYFRPTNDSVLDALQYH